MIQRSTLAHGSLIVLLVASMTGCSAPRFREQQDGSASALDASQPGDGGGSSVSSSNGDNSGEPEGMDGDVPDVPDAKVGDAEAGPDPEPGPEDTGVLCDAVPLVAPGMGHAVITGDFDGDLRPDLVLGHPAHGSHAGRACVFYGKNFVNNQFAGSYQALNQNSPNVPGSAEGLGDIGDRLGFSLAVGDFDTNGVVDLAVGVPFEDILENGSGPVAQQTGLVDLFFGTRNVGLLALNAQGIPILAPQDWHQERDGPRAGVNASYDLTSHGLAALDIDRDGASDLFLGAPGEGPAPDTQPSSAKSGAVLELSGPLADTTLAKSFAFTAEDFADIKSWPVTSSQRTRSANEYLGATLLAVPTDLPGNTARSLLLASAPGENGGIGAVYGWLMDPALGFTAPTKKFVINPTSDGAGSFGKALMSDGQRVFIGSPGESKGEGRVYVVDLTNIPIEPSPWPAFTVLAQPAAVAGGPEPGDAFGHSLALQHRADFDLLLVGAPGEALNGSCNAGIVHRFRAADLSYYDSVEGDPESLFGYAVGAGDFDGDGVDEAVGTAPKASTEPLMMKIWD